MSFAEFKKDINAFNAELAEVNKPRENKEEKEFKELEDGTYICKMNFIGLVESKKGAPMLKVEFEVSEGEYTRSRMWLHQVLAGTRNDAYMMYRFNQFIESLKPSNPIEFNGDYDDLANDVGMLMNDFIDCTFEVVRETNDKGYTNLTVTDVFDN